MAAGLVQSDVIRRSTVFKKHAARLAIVQKQKTSNNPPATVDADESMSASVRTNTVFADGVSVVSGMSAFKHQRLKPKNLAKREIKENSHFEEDSLVLHLNAETINDEEESSAVNLISLL